MPLGVLISRDMYEGIRAAGYTDLPAVMDILRPLEAEGVLVARSEEQLLKDMGNCFLMVRDGAVLACGELLLHTYIITYFLFVSSTVVALKMLQNTYSTYIHTYVCYSVSIRSR